MDTMHHDRARAVPQDALPGSKPRHSAPPAAAARRRAALAKRRRLALLLLPWARRLATLAVMLVAIVMALVTWDYYVTAPWTRDGRVRVQVASVAPQISGQIVELRVADNQFVHKGDVLYVIDPFDFEVAVRSGKALLEQKAADLQVKQVQSDRRQHLSSIATSAEEQQVFAGAAVQAEAAFQSARQQLAQAEINLRRTEIRSPVNGYVTNLLLRVGDFAHAGTANVSVIDSDSYWIDGYFEETKMAQVCMGDRVEAKLMGYAHPITGHVSTVTRGIGVSNAAAGVQGLPNVDPIYTWVRLAQRVPVRVAIDQVPPGIPLVSGMTATVNHVSAAPYFSLSRHSEPPSVLLVGQHAWQSLSQDNQRLLREAAMDSVRMQRSLMDEYEVHAMDQAAAMGGRITADIDRNSLKEAITSLYPLVVGAGAHLEWVKRLAADENSAGAPTPR